MAVNLSKNGSALTTAYQEVVDEKSSTNWALFTYEGNSDDIRLAAKGDGGLEEMIEDLSSGKVMYAFCRVEDPNSGLPKYVLVNWTGEGVKDARKGICANHVSTMAKFLKGAHITINARGDEDVEPEVIMEKVAKASGANYSFHKETSNRFRDSGPQGPVGSVYQKTNAVSEIKKTNKDNFWAQTEKEEEKRRQEERRRANEERQVLENERKDREAKEASLREKRDKERGQQIDQQKKYQQQLEAESKEQEKKRYEEQQESEAAQRKAVRRGESVEKANEAASLISQRALNPREMFKQRERGITPSDSDDPAAAPAPAPASPQPGRLHSPFLSKPVYEPEPPRSSPHQASSVAARSASPAWATEPEVGDGQSRYEEEEEEEGEEQEQEQEQEEEQKEEPQDQLKAEPVSVYSYVQEKAIEEQAKEENVTAEESSERGICAKALYDYQAADDTEISFDPDDFITGIEMIDEGWWRGYAPDGHFGMFPANYVELV